MISKKLEEIINLQIDREFYSSNLYLSMAIWAETNSYNGSANWFYAQANEERDHMLKFISYLNDRGGKAIVPAIKKPPFKFKDLKTVFQMVLDHEIFISNSINEIVALTIEEKDYSTHSWIQFFVAEQIQEEKSVNEIIDKLKLVGEHNIYMFDRDIMSLRTE